MSDSIKRMWWLARTRVLWKWRLRSCGGRAVLGRCRLVRNPKCISIGDYTTLADGWLLADLDPEVSGTLPKIRIGAHCMIMHDFQCNARISVELQDCVLVAPRVFISDSDHVVDPGGPRVTRSREFRSAPVVIEHDCWLGVNAVILKGVRIGHHSVVGANAVVTHDVPALSIVAGAPAEVIGRTDKTTDLSGARGSGDAGENVVPNVRDGLYGWHPGFSS